LARIFHPGKVIQTMRDTGRDLKPKHKETSRGRLAVSVVECWCAAIGFRCHECREKTREAAG